MDAKTLAIRLADSLGENDVVHVLTEAGYWTDSSAWKPYGDLQNNASIVFNQQSLPEASLVELLVNSTDALLMGRCKQACIDPSDQSTAPESIDEAVEKWFGIGRDHFAGITNSERNKLAQLTGLVATGDAKIPSYVIFDFGEGQNPSDFEKTFLSLAGSNKLSVPFVQGKFNQGSTGVLRFCGTHGLKLIISRKDPKIAHANEYWGVTVVRKILPSNGMRSSVFQYLAPMGTILSFKADNLPILPGAEHPAYTGGAFAYGTFVKLFDYAIGPGFGTNILFDLNYRISTLLTRPSLPIRLYERRSKFKGHSMETTLNGLEFRLEDDRNDNVEPGFPIPFQFETKLGRFAAKIYALKETADRKRFSGKEGVVFSLNGQLHGSFERSFFSRKKVKLDYLRDSLVLIVDITQLDPAAIEELIMPSRDRLADGQARLEIEEALTDFLANDDRLIRLRTERREQELGKRLEDNKFTVDLLNKILKKSPVLSRIFVSGEKLPNPYGIPLEKKAHHFEGKQHPTFFRQRKTFSEEAPRKAQVGRSSRFQFETDVNNDYLSRSRHVGLFTIEFHEGGLPMKLSWTMNPFDGIWTLGLTIPEGFPLGRKIRVKYSLIDDTLLTPFEGEFWIFTTEKLPDTPHQSSGRRVSGANATGGSASSGGLALPQINEVRKPQWERYGFDQNSALKVISSGEGYDFYVNMDNVYLGNEIRQTRSGLPAVMENRFKLGVALIGMALISREDNDKEVDSKHVEQIIDSIAPILLPMVDGLSNLDSQE